MQIFTADGVCLGSSYGCPTFFKGQRSQLRCKRKVATTKIVLQRRCFSATGRRPRFDVAPNAYVMSKSQKQTKDGHEKQHSRRRSYVEKTATGHPRHLGNQSDTIQAPSL